MRRFFALAFILAAFAHAQIDPEAQLLLDRWADKAAELSTGMPLSYPIDTIQMNLTSISYIPEAEFTMTMEMSLERLGKRLAAITYIDTPEDEPEFESDFGFDMYMLYENGNVSAVTAFMDELEVIPFDAELNAVLSEQYNALFDMLETPPIEPDYTFARYDGVKNYGDVLIGLQVTFDGAAMLAAMPAMNTMGLTLGNMSVVFSADNLMAGYVTELEGQTILMVLDEPIGTQMGFTQPSMNMTMYTFADGTATLTNRVEIDYVINEVLEPSLFELPEVTAD